MTEISEAQVTALKDVEILVKKLEETMKGCTILLENLQENRTDTEQCEKIAGIGDTKLRYDDVFKKL